MKKLKTLVITLVVAVSMVSLLIAMIFVGRETFSAVETASSETSDKTAAAIAKSVDGFMQRQTGVMNAVAILLERTPNAERGPLSNLMYNMIQDTEGMQDLYYALEDKTIIIGSGSSLPEGFDPTARGWYIDAKNTDGLIFTTPYVNASDGVDDSTCVSLAMPFHENGRFAGVVGVDLELNGMLKDVDDCFDDSDGSYCFITNSEGVIYVHPNKEYIPDGDNTVSISEVNGGAYIDGLESRSAFEDYTGEDMYISEAEVAINGWKIYLVTPKSTIMAASSRMYTVFIVTGIISAVISVLASFWISRRITSPILYVEGELENVGQLDLITKSNDKNVDKYSLRKDELGIMVKSMATLKESLTDFAGQLKGSTETISTKSEDMQAAVSDNNRSLEAVLETISQISIAVDAQAADAQSGIEELSNFSKQIGDVVDDARNVKDNTELSVKKSEAGIEKVAELSEKIAFAEDMQNKAKENVNVLSEKSKLIDEITNSIIEIASQTNLLALNASIEAARAGDAGKGFAVVAEEIRKLAEETADATSKITSIVGEIQNEVGLTQESIDSIGAATGECVAAMESTTKAFADIKDQTTEVGANMKHLSTTLEDINTRKNSVVTTFSNISSASEEIAASTSEINSRADQQKLGMDQIAESVEELIRVIDDLETITNKFRV